MYNNFKSIMLQSIISSKVQKSKQNIQTYLSNGSQVQSQSQPKQQPAPQTAPRPSQQPTTFHSQSNGAPTQNKAKPIKNEVEVKIMNVAGKQCTKQGMLFRFNKEENRFQFHYEEDGIKVRMEGKRDILTGKRIKVNFADGSCAFQIKTALLKKQDVKQTSLKGTPCWSTGKQVAQQTVVIWLKDKDQLKLLMQTPFMEGLYDPNSTAAYIDVPKPIEIQPIEEGVEAEQDHGHVKLAMPTAAQQGEVDKIRKTIRQMKQEDKVTVLMQVFKIKKEYEDPNNIKKLKCPVHYCIYCQKKSYKDLQQLKNHLKMKHPELSKHGIQLSEYDGTFDYGSKALDLALFIGKMYPQQMKKIIKQMKTKTSE